MSVQGSIGDPRALWFRLMGATTASGTGRRLDGRLPGFGRNTEESLAWYVSMGCGLQSGRHALLLWRRNCITGLRRLAVLQRSGSCSSLVSVMVRDGAAPASSGLRFRLMDATTASTFQLGDSMDGFRYGRGAERATNGSSARLTGSGLDDVLSDGGGSVSTVGTRMSTGVGQLYFVQGSWFQFYDGSASGALYYASVMLGSSSRRCALARMLQSPVSSLSL